MTLVSQVLHTPAGRLELLKTGATAFWEQWEVTHFLFCFLALPAFVFPAKVTLEKWYFQRKNCLVKIRRERDRERQSACICF